MESEYSSTLLQDTSIYRTVFEIIDTETLRSLNDMEIKVRSDYSHAAPFKIRLVSKYQPALLLFGKRVQQLQGY